MARRSSGSLLADEHVSPKLDLIAGVTDPESFPLPAEAAEASCNNMRKLMLTVSRVEPPSSAAAAAASAAASSSGSSIIADCVAVPAAAARANVSSSSQCPPVAAKLVEVQSALPLLPGPAEEEHSRRSGHEAAVSVSGAAQKRVGRRLRAPSSRSGEGLESESGVYARGQATALRCALALAPRPSGRPRKPHNSDQAAANSRSGAPSRRDRAQRGSRQRRGRGVTPRLPRSAWL